MPLLLTLYEILGNYTIDEIKSLELDSNFNKSGFGAFNIKPLAVENITIVNNRSLEDQHDISYNTDDLMRIKQIECGTWFTCCTSQMFPSIIYVFGNCYKNVIKITYFEINKLEIKQLSVSNYHICVLTTDNSVYKINLNFLSQRSSGKEADKIDNFDNLEINKIGCGYDYLVILTKNKQAIYNPNFEKEKTIFLNSEIKSDINDFATGPSHMFVVSKLNDFDFHQYLFDKIQFFTEYSEDKNVNADVFLIDSQESSFNIPCHSFIINQFLNLAKFKKTSKGFVLNISKEKILMLLELVYTSNLQLFNEDSKKLLEDPEVLETLNCNLKEILLFIQINKINLEQSALLIDLINLYLKKIEELLNSERVPKDYERFLLNKKLAETCNYIINDLMKIQVKDNITLLKRNSFENNNLNQRREEEMLEQEEGEDELNQRNRNRNVDDYFQQFANKGTKVNIISNTQDIDIIKNIDLNDYLEVQKKLIDYRYQFYIYLTEIKENLKKSKDDYLRKNLPENYRFDIKYNNSYNSINSLMLEFKSLYFNNYIKIIKEEYNQNKCITFDIKQLGIEYSSSIIESIIKFLNNEIFEIDFKNVFEILEASTYFMIDNLTSIIEIELENEISKFYFFNL